MATRKVSPDMKRAMALALETRLGSWDVGAATLSALKKRGWIYETRLPPVGWGTSARCYTLSPEGLEVWKELAA